jgi:hypothetical protein
MASYEALRSIIADPDPGSSMETNPDPGSGITSPIIFPRDPGWKNPDPTSGIEKSRSRIQDGKIHIQDPGWKNPYPGSRMEKSRSWIRDPGLKNPDPGSQHCFTENVGTVHCTVRWYSLQFTTIPDKFLVVRCVCVCRYAGEPH